MTLHPDEQARELLKPHCTGSDDHDYENCRKCEQMAEEIAALLAKARLAEAECMYANWNVDESIRSFDAWAKNRIASLRQAAGERTK